jgi:hypothetical protein
MRAVALAKCPAGLALVSLCEKMPRMTLAALPNALFANAGQK